MADFKLEDDLFDHYSHGWFPSCYNAREFTIYGSSFFQMYLIKQIIFDLIRSFQLLMVFVVVRLIQKEL